MRAKHKTLAEVRSILSNIEASGLSTRAYCAKHELPYSTAMLWRRRAREAGEAGESPKEISFVEVRAKGEARMQDFQIEFASGVRLHVPVSFEESSLRRLLTILESSR